MGAVAHDPGRPLSPYPYTKPSSSSSPPTSPTSPRLPQFRNDSSTYYLQRVLRRTAGLPRITSTSIQSLLLLGAIFLLIFWSSSFSRSLVGSATRHQVASSLSFKFASQQLPSKRYESITTGRWVLPSVPVTSQDVEDKWGMRPGGLQGSRGPQRPLEVASWEWEGLEEMKEWDAFEFVKRCFNSEVGFVLVGDSVQIQAAKTLHSMLHVSRSEKYNMSNTDSWLRWAELGDPGLVHGQMVLREDTDLRAILAQELPHVLPERFDRAFAHTIRHDTLLHPSELDSIADGLGLTTEMQGYLRHDTWEGGVLPTGEERSWRGKQNSVVWISTGPHWSSVAFEMDRKGLLELSRVAATTLLTRLVARPSLDIIYRSTATAHPGCENAATPIFPAVGTVDHPVNTRWDWGIFDPINQIWADELDRVAPKGVSKTGGKVAFLDVTEMAGQRPDAHEIGNLSQQEADCLHWALPTVPGTWLKMLWHIMSDN